jgi:hypothetical protein
MSHVTTVAVEFKDLDVLEIAARKLGAPFRREETVRFMDGNTVTGPSVRLAGWHYPVVLADKKLHMDNYGGHWGKPAELDRLKQVYAIEVTKKQAKKQGFRVRETHASDGTVKLTLSK